MVARDIGAAVTSGCTVLDDRGAQFQFRLSMPGMQWQSVYRPILKLWTIQTQVILFDIRLPRVLLAMFVGSGSSQHRGRYAGAVSQPSGRTPH